MGKANKPEAGEHGVELVDRVIARVRAEGLGAVGGHGEPRGLTSARLRGLKLPEDKVVTPSMARWLAFDASFFGWLRPRQRKLEGETLGAWAHREYGEDWGFSAVDEMLPGRVLPLPHGADSRRCLYLGEVDEVGEYPVLLTDVDDGSYVGIEYPGLDVYLADCAGVVEPPKRTYGAYAEHPTYSRRMQAHADRLFGGRIYIDIAEHSPQTLDAIAETGMRSAESVETGDDMVEVVVGRNPMTGLEVTRRVPRAKVRPGQKIVGER